MVTGGTSVRLQCFRCRPVGQCVSVHDSGVCGVYLACVCSGGFFLSCCPSRQLIRLSPGGRVFRSIFCCCCCCCCCCRSCCFGRRKNYLGHLLLFFFAPLRRTVLCRRRRRRFCCCCCFLSPPICPFARASFSPTDTQADNHTTVALSETFHRTESRLSFRRAEMDPGEGGGKRRTDQDRRPIV